MARLGLIAVANNKTQAFKNVAHKTMELTGSERAYCVLELVKNEYVVTVQTLFRAKG